MPGVFRINEELLNLIGLRELIQEAKINGEYAVIGENGEFEIVVYNILNRRGSWWLMINALQPDLENHVLIKIDDKYAEEIKDAIKNRKNGEKILFYGKVKQIPSQDGWLYLEAVEGEWSWEVVTRNPGLQNVKRLEEYDIQNTQNRTLTKQTSLDDFFNLRRGV